MPLRNPDSNRRFFGSPAGARTILAILCTAGLLVLVLSPSLKRLIGIVDFDFWFLDSYAVLAASDAAQAGLDPKQPNPLDVLQRSHAYTDWWFVLGNAGLTRTDNFLVGGSWVLAFLFVAWATARPRRVADALLFAAILLSPPVLLAVNRANNDLVVFTLLGLAALALGDSGWWRTTAALLAIALATGLKFYPAAAAFVFLLLRPRLRMAVMCGVAAAVVTAVLLNVAPALSRGMFTVPQAVYTMGGVILLRDLGLDGGAALLTGVATVGVAATLLVWRGITVGLADSSRGARQRVLFSIGAAVLVACFLAGASFAYRWVFAIWLAPWLVQESRETALSPQRRAAAQLALWLLCVVLWVDGLYCLVTNIAIGPMPLDQLERWALRLRLATQPLTWALMMMLAGWILDAALAAWRELWGAKQAGSTRDVFRTDTASTASSRWR